jgi:hypothetical protein
MLGPAAEPVLSDEDLAAEDVNGELLMVIPLPVWSRLRTASVEHALLVAAERGGAAAIHVLLRQAHLPIVD